MKRKFLILGIVMSGLTCAQDNYDKWRKIYGGPDIRYVGAKENNSILEAYLKCKKEKCLEFDHNIKTNK